MIGWYPGHMAKAKRELREQLKRADVVVELCDARLPLSSRNPELRVMAENKKRVLLLNKADLADDGQTAKWIERFAQECPCARITATKGAKEALRLIEQSAREAVARAESRGIHKIVRAMVVGVPNVGKSTLINRLCGSSLKAADRPGVTRASTWVRATPYLEILDTPGLLWPRIDDQRAALRLAYLGSIGDNALDEYDLSIRLIDDMMTRHFDLMRERYRILDESARGQAALEALCRGRGFLQKGGECDLDRGAKTLLDEFRGGKLGKLTLEEA